MATKQKSSREVSQRPPCSSRFSGTRIAILLAAGLSILLVWWVCSSKMIPIRSLGRSSNPSGSSSINSVPKAPLADHFIREHPGNASGDSLLQQMDQAASSLDADATGALPTLAQLDKQFATITENQQQVNDLKRAAQDAAAAQNLKLVQKDVDEGKPLVSLLNLRVAAFEKDLAAARRERPQNSTVEWLTGELLMIVGGEPEEIVPYLSHAVASGLKQPRLFADLATAEFDLNHFQHAYDHALKAVEEDPQNRRSWEIYSRASFGLERFGEVIKRLDQAFPSGLPPWAAAIRNRAERMLAAWVRELALRRHEDQAGDLPMVHLLIEHRKFDAEDAKPVSSGRGDVVIELFENEAPETVANFIHLVETGFYDGTSFYWAEAGHMVVAGDPNKRHDPAEQGIHRPGYFISDEFHSLQARGHFRGTISTVETRNGTAGGQFFISLVPSPEFDGQSTAFGRVTQGQTVLDQITEGRTDRHIGQFGRIIPGDLIVHAEVIRKRAHAYPAIKSKQGQAHGE